MVVITEIVARQIVIDFLLTGIGTVYILVASFTSHMFVFQRYQQHQQQRQLQQSVLSAILPHQRNNKVHLSLLSLFEISRQRA